MDNNPKKSLPAIVQRARELRRPLTPQEQKLWRRLRNRQLCGLKFRRQHPLRRVILDFYCHEQQLAIEVDGDREAALQIEHELHHLERIEAHVAQQVRRVLEVRRQPRDGCLS